MSSSNELVEAETEAEAVDEMADEIMGPLPVSKMEVRAFALGTKLSPS